MYIQYCSYSKSDYTIWNKKIIELCVNSEVANGNFQQVGKVHRRHLFDKSFMLYFIYISMKLSEYDAYY